MQNAADAPTIRRVVHGSPQPVIATVPRRIRVGMVALAMIVVSQVVMAAAGLTTAADGIAEFGVPLIATLLVAERARRTRTDRTAWLAVSASLLLLIAGNAYCTLAFSDPLNPPVPSLADIAYLTEYPVMFLALGLLVRGRTLGFRASMWIDGAVAMLSIAALWTALDPPRVGHTGSIPAELVLHAYVIGDLVIGSAAIGTLALFTWRAGADWIAIVCGITVQAVADLLTSMAAPGATGLLQLISLLWSLAVAAFVFAAWMPASKRSRRAVAGWRAQAPTVAFSVVALGVLVAGVAGDVPVLARTLATCALAAAIGRLLWTANENVDLEFARRLALTDDLTGLGNRRELMAAMRAACAGDGRFAVLLIDLDGFKEVNDTLGHAAGDTVLRTVADRFSRLVRPDDVLVRLGGDEFGVLLGACDADGAVTFADRMAEVLTTGFHVQGINVRVDASTGIAVATGPETPSELLRRADVAMYEAKRNYTRRAVYRAETDERSPARLATLQELREAIAARALEVHYQPKANLRSSRVYGLEALVRWRMPDGTLLPPAAFLPLAERAGLMYELTLFVLERAMRDIARLRERNFDLTVAVNVPPMAILDATLVRDIARLLDAAGLPANALEVEITEDSLMADRARAQSLITDLRQLGVAVSIDDYGTGYSSLPYLRDLEVDSLKLDRSFVTGIANSDKARTIVASTIQLAHALGMWVVAEGVESNADRHALEALDCDAVQGYLVSRPVPIETISASITDTRAA